MRLKRKKKQKQKQYPPPLDCYGIDVGVKVGKIETIKINGIDFPIEEWYD